MAAETAAAPHPEATETAQTPGQTRIYYPPPPGAEAGQPARLQQELADIRHETAAVRFQLALLYDHNEDPPPAAAASNPHAQLAAARREYARLLDVMADYQQTETQNNDSLSTRSAANNQRAAADYHRAAAEEQTRPNRLK